ncbi:hypothetical protein EJB05_06225, partial [Eragrostis curvula]
MAQPDSVAISFVILVLLLPSPCVGKPDHCITKPSIWSFEATKGVSGTVHKSHTLYPLKIPLLVDVTGVKSLAFDRWDHGPYVGISDGRILRWNGKVIG